MIKKKSVQNIAGSDLAVFIFWIRWRVLIARINRDYEVTTPVLIRFVEEQKCSQYVEIIS